MLPFLSMNINDNNVYFKYPWRLLLIYLALCKLTELNRFDLTNSLPVRLSTEMSKLGIKALNFSLFHSTLFPEVKAANREDRELYYYLPSPLPRPNLTNLAAWAYPESKHKRHLYTKDNSSIRLDVVNHNPLSLVPYLLKSYSYAKHREM